MWRWRVMPALIAAAGLGVTAPAHASATAGGRPAIAYVLNGPLMPINTKTDVAWKPIPLGRGAGAMTATGKAGPLIPVTPGTITITPHGKTAYVTTTGGLTPISTATNAAGTQIPVAGGIRAVVASPDSKTLYVAAGNSVIPISTATGKAGKPVRLLMNGPRFMAFTPDSKTLYVAGLNSGATIVQPVNVAAGTAAAPIGDGGVDTQAMAMTPDGKTLFVVGNNNEGDPQDSIVTPISMATNTAGKVIPEPGSPEAILITPARRG